MDWGLGHASRCVPIIKNLLNKGAKVTLGGSGFSGDWLRKEFPNLPYIEFPGYNIRYSIYLPMFLQIFLKLPSILFTIRRENRFLKKWLKSNSVDVIISDNRYGLYCENIYSVFITHQININAGNLKFLEPLLLKLNKKMILKFDQCWIPDFKGDNSIAGHLSQISVPSPQFVYIGLLSRFTNQNITSAYMYDCAIVISGPEPLRTKFENKIAQVLKNTSLKILVVRGTQKSNHPFSNKIEVINHANTNLLIELINKSKFIVSRSGYSSVMDWIKIGKQALLIPTPGQTEQVYLAKNLQEKAYFPFKFEDDINETDFHFTTMNFVPPSIPDNQMLELTIERLLAHKQNG